MGKTLRAGVVAAVAIALTAAAVRSVWPGGSWGWTLEPPKRPIFSSVVSETPREVEVYRIRSEAKAAVIGRLAAGELDLFAAAALFRDLNREPPEFRPVHFHGGSLDRPGQSDEEKLCLQVILWAKSLLPEKLPASRVERLLAELEAALADRLRQSGRIELPDHP